MRNDKYNMYKEKNKIQIEICLIEAPIYKNKFRSAGAALPPVVECKVETEIPL